MQSFKWVFRRNFTVYNNSVYIVIIIRFLNILITKSSNSFIVEKFIPNQI